MSNASSSQPGSSNCYGDSTSTTSSIGTTRDLSAFLIPGSNEAYYIPNFVTEEEEQYLITKILQSPQQKWKNLANRRLQLLGGTISHAKQTLLAEPMPGYLTSYPNIIARLRDLGIFKDSKHREPNHVILNEYLAGQGIMPHEDGPSYHPVVATITLGSHAVFHYYRYADETPTQDSACSQTMDSDCKPTSTSTSTSHGRSISPYPILSVLLEARSLVITRKELYEGCLHGIDEVVEDHFHVDPASESQGLSSTPKISIVSRRQVAENCDTGTGTEPPLTLANAHLLSSSTLEKIVNEGRLVRETRWSLTCRDVEKVVRVGGPGVLRFGGKK